MYSDSDSSRGLRLLGNVLGRCAITGSNSNDEMPSIASSNVTSHKKRTVTAINAVSAQTSIANSSGKATGAGAKALPATASDAKRRKVIPDIQPLPAHVYGAKLLDLSLRVTVSDVAAFFSGLRLCSVHICFYAHTSSSEVRCVAYARFESSHGADLAVQRSGEMLRGDNQRVIVQAADAWELFCAEALGYSPESSITAREVLLQARELISPVELILIAPAELAAYWRQQIVRYRACEKDVTPMYLLDMLRVAHNRSVLDLLVVQGLEDGVSHLNAAQLEGKEFRSLDDLQHALRQRLKRSWCNVAALQAESGDPLTMLRHPSAVVNALHTSLHRTTRLYEQIYCILQLLCMEQKDLGIGLQ